MMEILLKGLAIGFLIAAPVGPIGVLCIRRTLAQGRSVGLATGLGAATADALYGSVAAFGLTLVSDFLIAQRFWFQLIGGVFLLYLGVRTLLTQPADEPANASGKGSVGAYSSTFFLTVTNPMTILAFVAVFAGFQVVIPPGDYLAPLALVVGVLSGSAAWWLLLSGGVSLLRAKFDRRAMRWVNRISGIIIVAFALAALFALGAAQEK